jgi:hypothetical protein
MEDMVGGGKAVERRSAVVEMFWLLFTLRSMSAGR